jgi:hypothetical protein
MPHFQLVTVEGDVLGARIAWANVVSAARH